VILAFPISLLVSYIKVAGRIDVHDFRAKFNPLKS
jgi:hypothetical protein